MTALLQAPLVGRQPVADPFGHALVRRRGLAGGPRRRDEPVARAAPRQAAGGGGRRDVGARGARGRLAPLPIALGVEVVVGGPALVVAEPGRRDRLEDRRCRPLPPTSAAGRTVRRRHCASRSGRTARRAVPRSGPPRLWADVMAEVMRGESSAYPGSPDAKDDSPNEAAERRPAERRSRQVPRVAARVAGHELGRAYHGGDDTFALVDQRPLQPDPARRAPGEPLGDPRRRAGTGPGSAQGVRPATTGHHHVHHECAVGRQPCVDLDPRTGGGRGRLVDQLGDQVPQLDGGGARQRR